MKLKINKNNSLNIFFGLLLLLFPFLNLSPYITLAETVISLTTLHCISKNKGRKDPTIKKANKFSVCFSVILLSLFLLQTIIVAGFDRVTVQRSAVLILQIYICILYFLFATSSMLKIENVIRIACLFSIGISLFYLLWIVFNGLPSERDSILDGFSSNFFAVTLYLFFPLYFYYLSKYKKSKYKTIVMISWVLSLIVIITTGSRTAMGTVAIIVFIMIAFSRWDLKKVLLLAGLFLVGLFSISYISSRSPEIQALLQRASAVFSGDNIVQEDIRTLIWAEAVSIFNGYNKFLGSGTNYIQFYDIYEPAHNFYLETLLGYGYFGLLLLILSNTSYFIISIYKKDKEKIIPIVALFIGYLVTAYVQPFFSTSFNCGLIVWISMYCIGCDDPKKS